MLCSALLCYATPFLLPLICAVPAIPGLCSLHLLCATTNDRRCNASRSLLIAMKNLHHRQYLWAALKCGLKCTSRSSLSFVCSIIYRWQNVISWSILQILDFTAIKAYRWRSALDGGRSSASFIRWSCRLGLADWKPKPQTGQTNLVIYVDDF